MSTFADRIDLRRRRARAAAGAGELAPDALESVDAPKVCLMRFVLALSALVITFVDPSEPDRFVTLTYGTLLLYTVYSGVLYLMAARTGTNPSSSASTWIDVGCYLVFITLSSGTGSIFFFFFFFAILVASFRGGFAGGLRVTLVSTLLFTGIGYATSPAAQFELNRFLLRPIYMLVLGYMIAVWGGSELNLKRRLALLKTISRAANPRFGIDQTVGAFMECVRKFFAADTCLLVTQDRETLEYFLRRADHYKADRAVTPERVSGEIGCQLASLLGEEAVAVASPPRRGDARQKSVIIAGAADDANVDARWLPVVDSLGHLIGDESFLSVPWRPREGAAARLYVTANARKFDRGDLDFLRQVVEHATPLIENVQLLDQLASLAAEQERQRISRDLHDSTIQPYIGLKLGLESVCRKALADNPLSGDLRELLQKTELGLADLRRYVHGLKREEPEAAAPALASAVRQYAQQFTRLYGVAVSCEAQPGIALSDRLSAEALQLVREGLSNVRRHTNARRAAVRLGAHAGALVLEIENETQGAQPLPFTPRSIRERAEALGGRALVSAVADRVTIVRVEIPL